VEQAVKAELGYDDDEEDDDEITSPPKKTASAKMATKTASSEYAEFPIKLGRR
jgi:hypothetical protein